MPQHKSCKKRVKTSGVQRERNRAFRTRLRAAIRDLRGMTSKTEAGKKYAEVVSYIDRAASYGLLHQNNADRNKARLALFVQRLP